VVAIAPAPDALSALISIKTGTSSPSVARRPLQPERSAFSFNRHPGPDPGSIFFNPLAKQGKGGCRIKSGMTKPDQSNR
jgi:hypothetical protein